MSQPTQSKTTFSWPFLYNCISVPPSLLEAAHFSPTASVVISKWDVTVSTLMMNILQRRDTIGNTTQTSKKAHTRSNSMHHSSRLGLCDRHGSHSTARTDYRCTLTLQGLDGHALVILLLRWREASILLVCRWWTGRVVVCKWRLSERRAKVAVIVLRWLLLLLLLVGNVLLSLLRVMSLLRVVVVVLSNGRFLHCE
jgi:hypothetical protein